MHIKRALDKIIATLLTLFPRHILTSISFLPSFLLFFLLFHSSFSVLPQKPRSGMFTSLSSCGLSVSCGEKKYNKERMRGSTNSHQQHWIDDINIYTVPFQSSKKSQPEKKNDDVVLYCTYVILLLYPAGRKCRPVDRTGPLIVPWFVQPDNK